MDIKKLFDLNELNNIALDKQAILQYSKYDGGFLFHMFERAGILPPKENIIIKNQGAIDFLIKNYALSKEELKKINSILYSNNPLLAKIKIAEDVVFTKEEIKVYINSKGSILPKVDFKLSFDDVKDVLCARPENYVYEPVKQSYLASCVKNVPVMEIINSKIDVLSFFVSDSDFIKKVGDTPGAMNVLVDNILNNASIKLSIANYEKYFNAGASPNLLKKISSSGITKNIGHWEPIIRNHYPDFTVNDVLFSLEKEHMIEIVNKNPTKSLDYSILSKINFYNLSYYRNADEITSNYLPEDFKIFCKILKLYDEEQTVYREKILDIVNDIAGNIVSNDVSLPEEKILPILNEFIGAVQQQFVIGNLTDIVREDVIKVLFDYAFKNNLLITNIDFDSLQKIVNDMDDSLNKAIFLTLIDEPLSDSLINSLEPSLINDLKKLKVEPLNENSNLFKEGFFKTEKNGYLNINMVAALDEQDVSMYLAQGFLIEEKAFEIFRDNDKKPSWLFNYVKSNKDKVPDFLKNYNNSIGNSPLSVRIKTALSQESNKDDYFSQLLNNFIDLNQKYEVLPISNSLKADANKLLMELDFLLESSTNKEHYLNLLNEKNLNLNKNFIKEHIKNINSITQCSLLKNYIENDRDGFDIFSVEQEMLFNYFTEEKSFEKFPLNRQVKIMIWLLMDVEYIKEKLELINKDKNELLFAEMKEFLIKEKPENVVEGFHRKKISVDSMKFSLEELVEVYKNYYKKTGMSWNSNETSSDVNIIQNYIRNLLKDDSLGFPKFLDALEFSKTEYPAFYTLLASPEDIKNLFYKSDKPTSCEYDFQLNVELFKESDEGKEISKDNRGRESEINWDLAYSFSLVNVDSYINGLKDLKKTYGKYMKQADCTELFKSKSGVMSDLQYMNYLEDDNVFYKSKKDVQYIFDKMIEDNVENFYIFAERDKLVKFIGKDYVIDKMAESVKTIKNFNELFLFNFGVVDEDKMAEANPFQISPKSYIFWTNYYEEIFVKVIKDKPEFRDYVVYLGENYSDNLNYFNSNIVKKELNGLLNVVNNAFGSIAHVRAMVDNDLILERIKKVTPKSDDEYPEVSSNSFKL